MEEARNGSLCAGSKEAFCGWWGARMHELALAHHQMHSGAASRKALTQVRRRQAAAARAQPRGHTQGGARRQCLRLQDARRLQAAWRTHTPV